ncbi:MAG: RNA polymerase sigma-70 factor [Odoribacteraceae bacterium]|jgi:RNA polymerase sigma-70 factor (ECF subfamily)|nr:RNA polymerase sigma-70 factor [Odoribacteraceae bacterium]
MRVSETYLLDLLNEGKQQGFRLLYKEYYRTMVSFGLHYLQRREAVEDIVQDLFSDIWRRGSRFDSFPRLRTFLYTAVKNGCLNELKRERVRSEYLMSVREEDLVEAPDDRLQVEEEVYRMIFAVVERLPRRCREVFEYHLQGKKNEEIAALLSVSVATVKTQKNRAMNLLREQMGELFFVAVALQVL